MKTSSGAKHSSPREELVFFLDRSLGRETIATKLRDAGLHVKIHDDFFAKNARDDYWIPIVGKKNWLILTKDQKLRYRATEKYAVFHGGAKVFTLSSGNLTAEQMAEIFIKAVPRIEKIAAKEMPPFIAKIYSSGIVHVWVPRKQLMEEFKKYS